MLRNPISGRFDFLFFLTYPPRNLIRGGVAFDDDLLLTSLFYGVFDEKYPVSHNGF